MRSHEIRKSFLDFFKSKKHEFISSMSLVPGGDSTLLFTNAGMNQFKDIFTGQVTPKNKRATSSQKCVRAGGKHNDLECVGVTARHHTFFEMLGNFSFGDYFKKEAIQLGHTFLVDILKLDKKKLWITVHHDDQESRDLWVNEMSYPEDRVVGMGDKDNFWAMGETGPCGPCSEIHFDQGPEVGCKKESCDIHCDCDRYLEIWNLVFMQYEQKADGQRVPLPNPCIDTGMGLERLSSVVNGFKSNYDTDLFTPLTQKFAELSGVPYSEGDAGVSHRIIADHIKASSFLINDGIYPSNEGRGYVLRRIMRRAIRHSWLLGLRESIFPRLFEVVLDIYSDTYPELEKNKKRISQILTEEEKRFMGTIENGIQLFEKHAQSWQKQGHLPGEDAFKLYDTFGFPLDLTCLMAQEKGLEVDEKGFNQKMEEQKVRARKASMFGTGDLQGLHWNILKEGEQTFTGYENSSEKSLVLRVARSSKGQLLIVPQLCCFYGESGGQVGDRGKITLAGKDIEVLDCQMVEGYRTLLLDECDLDENKLSEIEMSIDRDHRQQTRVHHTSTHILHKILKETLGDHAEQRGSWVGPNRLRFDFLHNKAVSKSELETIEKKVNEAIVANCPLTVQQTSLTEAKESGVTALFGEKYGEDVRVVHIEGLSKELCGGTHLNSTGEALAFVLASESSVASGTRRIEAFAGKKALNELLKNRAQVKSISKKLQTPIEDLNQKIQGLLDSEKRTRKELEKLQADSLLSTIEEKLKKPSTVGDQPYLAESFKGVDGKSLKKLAEKIRVKVSWPILLINTSEDHRVSLICSTSKKSDKPLHAGQIMAKLCELVGGKGGGSPEFAQGAGSSPDGVEAAIKLFCEELS